jgi:hypothetical protein
MNSREQREVNEARMWLKNAGEIQARIQKRIDQRRPGADEEMRLFWRAVEVKRSFVDAIERMDKWG